MFLPQQEVLLTINHCMVQLLTRFIPCFQVSELASLNNNTYRTLGSPFILNHERTLTLKLRPDGNDYPVIGMDNEALSIKQVEKLLYA